MSILAVSNLSLKYSIASSNVIEVLNFSAEAGMVVMLAGRNGSGKSTLLRTLAGLQKPTEGFVFLGDKNLAECTETEIAGLVSMMFSTPPVAELTTVGEMVLTAMSRNFSPLKTDFTDEWREVKQCLSLCGMESYFDRDFSSLSDGEKQKVMLARSLAQNTMLILLDEPLAFLDYPSRIEMLELLQKLATEENKLILFSSHDLDISLNYCDQLLLLKSGGSWKLFSSKKEIAQLEPKTLFA